ncbi:DUF4355 domain-containing protein [Metaclostridioides mangenotii]|uniref:DUF4355 domain-containing protein n=1 Tax=Metaclostridioides mangenotii TaxID=1540 RepID=UPI0028ED1FCE|nr:DUF4355 domain-containing protein [Clostridioides mangenotii]
MLKRELIELLSNIEDDSNIDEILRGSETVKSFISSSQTLDAFKSKLNEEEFEKFLTSEKDKHANKYLETWKSNNLEKELEPFIAQKYPDLIQDPAQKEVLELKKQLERLEAEKNKEQLLNKAKEYALNKKLPTGFVSRLLAENEEETIKNIDDFEREWSSSLETKVKEEVKGSGYTPPSGGTPADMGIGAKIAKDRNSETNKTPGNPWLEK